MSENTETIPKKVEFTPIGYVENEYLEPGYNEEIYQKVSKIILRKDLAEGLYRVEELEKLYILFYCNYSAIPLVKAIFPLSEEKLHIK